MFRHATQIFKLKKLKIKKREKKEKDKKQCELKTGEKRETEITWMRWVAHCFMILPSHLHYLLC